MLKLGLLANSHGLVGRFAVCWQVRRGIDTTFLQPPNHPARNRSNLKYWSSAKFCGPPTNHRNAREACSGRDPLGTLSGAAGEKLRGRQMPNSPSPKQKRFQEPASPCPPYRCNRRFPRHGVNTCGSTQWPHLGAGGKRDIQTMVTTQWCESVPILINKNLIK